jgi:hypothetical protein
MEFHLSRRCGLVLNEKAQGKYGSPEGSLFKKWMKGTHTESFTMGAHKFDKPIRTREN